MNTSKRSITAATHVAFGPDKISSGIFDLDERSDEALYKDGIINDSLIKVVVKRTGALESNGLHFSLDPSATVYDLKAMIRKELAKGKDSEDLPAERQRLIFSGRMLTNECDSIESLKMKADEVNHVHLMPIPKGVCPSLRKPSENRAARMAPCATPSNRGQRFHHPYRHVAASEQQRRLRGSDLHANHYQGTARSAQPSLSTFLRNDRIQALHHQQSQHVAPRSNLEQSVMYQIAAIESMATNQHIPLGMPNFDSFQSSGVENLIELERAVLQDVNALLPHCHTMPSVLHGVVQENMVLTNTEFAIDHLEQLAHRSIILSLSLRSLLQGRRIWGNPNVDAMLHAYSMNGLPAGRR